MVAAACRPDPVVDTSTSDSGGDRWRKVALSRHHACALTEWGALHCWNDGEVVPELNDPPAGEFGDVDVGVFAACAITTTSEVTCWGDPSRTMVSEAPTSPAEHIQSSGLGNACAWAGALVPAALTCWGTNPGVPVPAEEGTTDYRFSLSSAGDCGSWADADGVGHTECTSILERSDDVRYTQLAGGILFGCGVTLGSEVECWGDPSAPPPPGPFVEVAVGFESACALRPGGELVCWGTEQYGEATPPDRLFRQVTMGKGQRRACGVTLDGELLCWGEPFPDPPEL